MRIAKIGKSLLAQAGKAGGDWVFLTTSEITASQSVALRREAYRLQKLGLLEISKGFQMWAPRIKRLRFRLTEHGREFVNVYSCELAKGTRVRSSKFAKITGKPLPYSISTGRVPQCLIANPPRGNSLNHGSAPASA